MESQTNTPTEIIKTNFFYTKKGKFILTLSIVFVLFILWLGVNSFRVDTNPEGKIVKITLLSQNQGFQAGDQKFDCPVSTPSCSSQKLIKVNNQDTVLYKAASGSSIISIGDIKSLDNIAVSHDTKTKKKYFYESVLSKDGGSCYTISYTLPEDAIFGSIGYMETFLDKKSIAQLGSETFKVEGENGTTLIQVRNTPLESGSNPCSLARKSPDFFNAL